MNYKVLAENKLYCYSEITGEGMVYISSLAMQNKFTTLGYWVVTIFIKLINTNEEIELEFIYNRPAEYRYINTITSRVLAEYFETQHPNIPRADLSGREWTAHTMISMLKKPDIDMMVKEGIPFFKDTIRPGESKLHYNVNYFDVPYEEAKILNDRPRVI